MHGVRNHSAYQQSAQTISFPTVILVSFVLVATLIGFPTQANATPEHPIVVSMGDSYSSGEGVEPFYGQENADKAKNPDWIAHRSANSWPGQLHIPSPDGTISLGDAECRSTMDNGGNWVEHKNWYFVAASGAETKHINGKQKKRVQYPKGSDGHDVLLEKQADVFDRIEEAYGSNAVDYVTITIGGNDMGFAHVLEAAVVDSSVINHRATPSVLAFEWAKYAISTKENIRRSYSTIAEKAGSQAKILVVGYPLLFDKSQDSLSAVFDPLEARMIRESALRLDKELQSIVAELRDENLSNIYYVSVADRFEGHNVCSLDPFLRGIVLGKQPEDIDQSLLLGAFGVSAYSCHPNPAGIVAYKEVVQDAIQEIEQNPGGTLTGAVAGAAGEDTATATVDNVITATAFAKEWYGDWYLDGNQVVRAEKTIDARCLPFIAKDSSLYSEFEAADVHPYLENGEMKYDNESRFGRPWYTEIFFDAKVEVTSERNCKLFIYHHGVQNDVTREMYDKLNAEMKVDTFNVVFDDKGYIIGIETIEKEADYALSQSNNDSADIDTNSFRQRFAAIGDAMSSDTRLGGTDFEMREATSDYLTQYKDLLNEVYAYADTQPDIDRNNLQSSQAQWETRKQQQIDTRVWEYRDGSLLGLMGMSDDMDWTKWRIEELLALLDGTEFDNSYRTGIAATAETVAYSIAVPSGWIDGQVVLEASDTESFPAEGIAMGHHTSVKIVGGTFDGATFSVDCFTENWGYQGEYEIRTLGAPSTLPGWRAGVATSSSSRQGGSYDPSDVSGIIDVFAQFITLK